jgi:hypothetical protein
MKKTVILLRNGLFWGIAFFILSFCIGYFNINMPIRPLMGLSASIGFFAMIVNGALYTRFTKPLKVLEKIEIQTQPDENLLIEAPANHLRDGSLLSGKLCLTDKRLLFKSHQQEEFIWQQSKLHSFVFYQSFQNKGGEFTLKDENNQNLMFEVDQLKFWKNALLKN